jgi:cytidine deaminase
MKQVGTKELIRVAANLVHPVERKGGLIGDVGCTLLGADQSLYKGVCASVGSNIFCAEQTAIGAMLTSKCSSIIRIVAVWKNEDGQVFVIPPCGNCRQLMIDIDERNLDCEVVIDSNLLVPLRDLVPHHDSWKLQDV